MTDRRLLLDYAQRWSVFLDGNVVETPRALLASGRRDGDAVILKVPKGDAGEALAGRALQHFGAEGAVKLIEHAGDGVVLLERAAPGRHLTELVLSGADAHATEILCEIMASIHKLPPADGSFPTVEQWGQDFARYRAGGDKRLSPALVQRAHELFDALCRTQGTKVLLHGDLHHDNVVEDDRRGWLAIDPKGIVGERAYEVGAALRNPTDDPRWFAERSIIEKRIAIFARCLKEDPKRLIAWSYAQAVLSAVWSVEDGEDMSAGLATAGALEPML